MSDPRRTYEEIKRLREKEREFSRKISEIPWIEVAHAAAWATRRIPQQQLAREWGVHGSTISLLIAATQLPKRILAFHDRYPRAIFLETTNCPAIVYDAIAELMEQGAKLTCRIVRDLARPHRSRKATRIHDLVSAREKATRYLKEFFRALPKGQARREVDQIVSEIEREQSEAERLGRTA